MVNNENIKDTAIDIICIEAKKLGFSVSDIEEFLEGRFDGDDLLTLNATEEALRFFKDKQLKLSQAGLAAAYAQLGDYPEATNIEDVIKAYFSAS